VYAGSTASATELFDEGHEEDSAKSEDSKVAK